MECEPLIDYDMGMGGLGMGNGCGMADLLWKTGLGCQKSDLSTNINSKSVKMHEYVVL